jgi:allantoinase
MRFDLAICNGQVVTPSGVFRVDIGVKDGVIAAFFDPLAVGGSLDSLENIDAGGKYVLPGVVDAHVHFNDPGLPEREDMGTGTSAAAAGGITTVVDMPLSGSPAIVSLEALELKKRAGEQRAKVDYALWGGLVNDNVDEMEKMTVAGAAAFKAFTCFAGDDFPYTPPEILLKGMKKASKLGVAVGVHCEEQSLLASVPSCRDIGEIDSFLESHSPLSERIATRAVLEMALCTGAKTHICHVTLPDMVDAVNDARGKGADVTVETCPHYLVFSDGDLRTKGAFLKCAPPVRSGDAIDAMWRRVLGGKIDIISSDHSPSTLAQKKPESVNFSGAWGGIQGIQTMLPLLHSEGVVKRGMSLSLLIELVSANPAKLFGLYPRKGALLVGSDADIVIFDPGKIWAVESENLLHKNKHTPYVGMSLQGRVEKTLLRGQTAYANGVVGDTRGILQQRHA